jgi:phage-related minor tail protein
VAEDQVNVSGTISVKDKASPTIRAIQKNIAGIGEAARKVGSQFSRFANMGALGGVAANATKAAGAMRTLGASILRVGGSLAALAGVAGFGGLAFEIQKYINSTDQLAKASIATGVSIKGLQDLRLAASLAGLGAEDLESGLVRLNKGLSEAARGKNKDLAGMLDRLGIKFKDAKGNARTAGDVMGQLANAVKNNKNQLARNDIVMAAFGKTGAKWIAMLESGKIGLDEVAKEMAKYGYITTQQTDDAQELADEQTRLGEAIGGVSNAIMGELTPAMTPVIKGMKDWVIANKDWMVGGVTTAMKDFGAAVKAIDWGPIKDGLKEFLRVGKEVFKAIGGWKTVLPGLAVILGGTFLAAIWSVVSAIVALNVALFTNPIVLAIAAIAGAAILIYRNWDGIKKFFSDLWANASKNFADAKKMLGDFVAGFVPDKMMEAWNALPEWWSNLWGRFTKPVVQGPDMPAPPPKLKDASWGQIADDAAVQWARLKGQVTDVATTIHEAFKPGETLGWTDALVSGDFGAAVKQKMAEFKAGFMTSGVIADFKAYFKPDEVIASWRDYDWTGAAKGFVDRFKSGFMTSGIVADFKALFKPDEIIASWGAIDFGAVWQRIKGSFDTARGWLDAFKAAFVPGAMLDAWTALDFAGIWSAVRAPFDAALGWLDDFAARFVPGGMLGAWQTYVAALSAIWAGPAAAFQRALGWLNEFRAGFVPADIAAAWQTVSATLSAIWDNPRAAFEGARLMVRDFLAAFQPGNILGVWRDAAAGLVAVWDNPRAAFEGALLMVRDFLARFVPGGMLGVWQTVAAGLSTIWNAPGEAFDAALTKLAEFAARFIPGPIMQAWGTVAGFFADLWNRVVSVFEGAWGKIKPIIDAIMAAIQPLLDAVGRVAGAASNIGSKIGNAASSAANTVRGYLPEALGGTPAGQGAPAPAMPPLSSISPVQAAQQAAPAQVARLDGEVETRIKIDLAPGLIASATTQDRGQVSSSVDVGTSMVPA